VLNKNDENANSLFSYLAIINVSSYGFHLTHFSAGLNKNEIFAGSLAEV